MPENDGVMSFDQLHKLGGREILDHEQWFDNMGLTESQKRERVRFAQDWEDILVGLLILVQLYDEYGMEMDDLKARMLREIRSLVEDVLTVNSTVLGYLEDYVRRFFEVTLRHLHDDPYYTSEDRAKDNGNQEATTIFNKKDFEEAVSRGAKYKTWHTMMDERVRGSHVEMEAVTIPINDLFIVGESLSEMAFPRDWSHGAVPEEIINCRCRLTFDR